MLGGRRRRLSALPRCARAVRAATARVLLRASSSPPTPLLGCLPTATTACTATHSHALVWSGLAEAPASTCSILPALPPRTLPRGADCAGAADVPPHTNPTPIHSFAHAQQLNAFTLPSSSPSLTTPASTKQHRHGCRRVEGPVGDRRRRQGARGVRAAARRAQRGGCAQEVETVT